MLMVSQAIDTTATADRLRAVVVSPRRPPRATGSARTHPLDRGPTAGGSSAHACGDNAGAARAHTPDDLARTAPRCARRAGAGGDRPRDRTAVRAPRTGSRMTAALRVLDGRTFRSLRRHRNYRLFFSGQVVSLSGTWMQNIALAWLVVQLTSSPVALGVLAFARFVPFTVFALPAGVLADRLDNRRVVMVTQAVSMAISTVLAALT